LFQDKKAQPDSYIRCTGL